jgi:hypothetical protein
MPDGAFCMLAAVGAERTLETHGRGWQGDGRPSRSVPSRRLALEGENSIDVRRGVRHRLAGCEKLFRDAEPDEQMKEKAAHSCRALCRARVLEEIPRHKRTETAEHLKLVLDIVNLRIRLAQAIHG